MKKFKYSRPSLIVIIMLVASTVWAEFSGLITEVYTEAGSPYQDWIEIYVENGGNVSGAELHYVNFNKTDYKWLALPSFSPEKGDYIIVLLNSSGRATGEYEFSGGIWTVYVSTDSTNYQNGMASSDGAIWLTSPASTSTLMDFMVFFDESAGDNIKDGYDFGSSKSQWSPSPEAGWSDADYIDNSVDSRNIYDGLSFHRKADSSGSPLDTDTKDDWKIDPTSRGEGYYTVQTTGRMLKVEDSPFFPHGDNSGYTALGRINYKLDSSDYYVTLAVYDINGYTVRRLISNETAASAQGSVAWNGYDDYGNIAPVGIYVVHLKAENRTTGTVKTAQDTIVVGRKFR